MTPGPGARSEGSCPLGGGRHHRPAPRPPHRADPPGHGQGARAAATIIDSQSVKAAPTVGKDSRGYDAGKKINGRKRHLVIDTRGLPLFVMVTPADLHDSAAAKEAPFRLRLMHPEITIVWADRAYAGKLVIWAKHHLNLTIKTVSRRRWVVERSLTWMMNPPPHPRLRATRPTHRDLDHLGSHHPHDQATYQEGPPDQLAREGHRQQMSRPHRRTPLPK